MPYAMSSDGVKLHYEVHDYTDPWKNAPPLILQHGYGRSSQFWYSLIPYIARFYKVICPDMRGLGQSSKDFDLATGISVEHFLGDILSVADAEDASTFHYAGESMGGIFGFAAAALHPQRVRTLSLLPRIKAPTLGLFPSDGKTASSDQLQTLKEKVPHAVVINVPNPYHMIWVLAPRTCAEHILHFMSSHDGRVCSEA